MADKQIPHKEGSVRGEAKYDENLRNSAREAGALSPEAQAIADNNEAENFAKTVQNGTTKRKE